MMISIGDVNWPPRSCDLTPLDFFLSGHVKGKVYADNPQTIPQLKDNIERVIGEIDPSLCENVMKHFGKRLVVCQKTEAAIWKISYSIINSQVCTFK